MGPVPPPLKTLPLSCILAGQFFSHSFLVIPACPAPLLGGDTLSRFPKALFCFLEPPFDPIHLQNCILQVHSSCQTCAQASPQGAVNIGQSLHRLRGHQPGEDWQVNFTHMPTHKKLRYLLTLVDIFTGWIEVFPVSRETADVVAQVLLDHIISQFGVP